MRRFRIGVLSILACAVLLIGCGSADGRGSEADQSPAPAAENSAEAAPEPEVEEFFVTQEARLVNGSLLTLTITEYDDAMRPVRRTDNGNPDHEWIYDGDLLVAEKDYAAGLRYMYAYEEGVLVHKDTFNLDGEGSLFRSDDYENDAEGRVLVDTWYNGAGEYVGEETFSYNPDGSYTRTTPYSDTPGETFIRAYDAEGRLIDNGQGSTWDYSDERLVRTVVDDSGNKVVITNEYTRDADGNIIHVDSSDFYDIGGVSNVYTIDYENENGKRVYSRKENSLLGGFEDHDVEEHYYIYLGTSGTRFGRDETGAPV